MGKAYYWLNRLFRIKGKKELSNYSSRKMTLGNKRTTFKKEKFLEKQ